MTVDDEAPPPKERIQELEARIKELEDVLTSISHMHWYTYAAAKARKVLKR